jgi:uncharacterized damage-inducible protein DinB
MKDEVQRLTDIYRNSFEGFAWHGPPVMEILKEVTPDQADRRLGKHHSIHELVAHMTAWRTFALEKLNGNEAYDVSEELNFPDPLHPWADTLNALRRSQEELLAALGKITAAKLAEKVPGKKYSFYTLLHGIIHHDLYHLGQIALIRKA